MQDIHHVFRGSERTRKSSGAWRLTRNESPAMAAGWQAACWRRVAEGSVSAAAPEQATDKQKAATSCGQRNANARRAFRPRTTMRVDDTRGHGVPAARGSPHDATAPWAVSGHPCRPAHDAPCSGSTGNGKGSGTGLLHGHSPTRLGGIDRGRAGGARASSRRRHRRLLSTRRNLSASIEAPIRGGCATARERRRGGMRRRGGDPARTSRSRPWSWALLASAKKPEWRKG